MVPPTNLRELLDFCYQQFPRSYVALDMTVGRHGPIFGERGSESAEYSFYIADVLRVEAPTVADLIERVWVGLKAKLDQRTAHADEVLDAMRTFAP